MIRKILTSAVIASSLVISANSFAITINDGGAGTVSGVETFDWTPGSSLAVDGLTLSADPANQTSFDLYSQGSLGNYLDSSSNAILGTGLNTDYEITYELGFGETGWQVANLAGFSFDPTGNTNYFAMYYDDNISGVGSTQANALEGTGYNDGDLILAGAIVQSNGSFSITLSDGQPVTSLLDGFLGDDWEGKETLEGDGGTSVDVDVSAQNQDYNFFLSDITSLAIDLFFTTNQTTPFDQTDPSKLVAGIDTYNFDLVAGEHTDVNGVCLTGVGTCDFLMQTDAANSFESVPEPSALALMGLGLLGFGVARRRKA